jgi:predicted nuclease with TOPRIM domain
MDIETLKAQLLECDRAVLELNYLFSETLREQELLLNYKNRLRVQAEEKRGRFFSLKMPLPSSVKEALNHVDKEIQRCQAELEIISCNIESCQLFRTNVERKLTQTFDS